MSFFLLTLFITIINVQILYQSYFSRIHSTWFLMHNTFYIFLDSFWYHSLEDVDIYIHKLYCSVVSLLCNVFVLCLYQSGTCLISSLLFCAIIVIQIIPLQSLNQSMNYLKNYSILLSFMPERSYKNALIMSCHYWYP